MRVARTRPATRTADPAISNPVAMDPSTGAPRGRSGRGLPGGGDTDTIGPTTPDEALTCRRSPKARRMSGAAVRGGLLRHAAAPDRGDRRRSPPARRGRAGTSGTRSGPRDLAQLDRVLGGAAVDDVHLAADRGVARRGQQITTGRDVGQPVAPSGAVSVRAATAPDPSVSVTTARSTGRSSAASTTRPSRVPRGARTTSWTAPCELPTVIACAAGRCAPARTVRT